MGYATVIAVYAPTEPRTTTTVVGNEAEAFYTLLQATVSNAPKKDRVIIVGDFNARVGADSEQWGSVIVLEQTVSSGAVSSAVLGPKNRIPMASDYLTSVPPMACSFQTHGSSTSRSISSPSSKMETGPVTCVTTLSLVDAKNKPTGHKFSVARS